MSHRVVQGIRLIWVSYIVLNLNFDLWLRYIPPVRSMIQVGFWEMGELECEEPAEIDCIWSSHRLLINPIKESQTNAQDWNTPQAQ